MLEYKIAMESVRAYTGKKPFVFVSYAHKDADFVFPFISELQKHFNVWFDEGIHLSKEWDKEIVEHINACSLFIYVVTKNSLKSLNCQDEIAFAKEKEKPSFFCLWL